VLFSIVGAGKVNSSDTVLEIGPGKGALTEALLKTGAKVVAIEKDRELIPFLEEKFAEYIKIGKLELLERDVLLFDLKSAGLETGKYKIVANIPYYITGAILKKFLEEEMVPELIVFLVQKEVADRIVARDKKESILSVSVKAFGIPRSMLKVSKKAFSPSPKVDSAVLLIENISHKNFFGLGVSEKDAIKLFFDVVHAGFAHKRKLLSRNLEDVSGKEQIARAFSEIVISEKARAEDLPIEKWLSLARSLSQK